MPDSHIWKHQLVDHEGAEAHFEFKVLSSHRTALRRQIAEAVEIRRQGEACLLNSKGMYNRCSLPRLVVEDDWSKDKVAGQACDNQVEEDWKKWKDKRDAQDSHGGGRRRKKLKLDEESQKEDNPRHQGLQKRKPQFETEYERECKKLRPEFDIDRELLFNNSPDELSTANHQKSYLIFLRKLNPTLINKKSQLQNQRKLN